MLGNFMKIHRYHGLIDRLVEIGRCCRMEMNVEDTKAMRMSRLPSPA
jgi:hypothetical protein